MDDHFSSIALLHARHSMRNKVIYMSQDSKANATEATMPTFPNFLSLAAIPVDRGTTAVVEGTMNWIRMISLWKDPNITNRIT